VKVSITQSTFKVINIKIVIRLAISSIISKELIVVAICKIEIFIIVTSDGA
jgi:hypothetical protein